MGSAGISLSGGQKQRLALARAVYAKPELIILDDVFSGLDAETEEQIFNRLFSSQGLLRKMKTTLLLVTHTVSRLSYSDHVIVLDAKGNIAEQGSFADLKTSGGYVQNLDSRSKSETQSDSGSEKDQSTPPSAVPQIRAAQVEEIDAITQELDRQSGDFAVYKHYFSAIGTWHTIVFLATATLYGTGTKFTEFLLTFCKYLQVTRLQSNL